MYELIEKIKNEDSSVRDCSVTTKDVCFDLNGEIKTSTRVEEFFKKSNSQNQKPRVNFVSNDFISFKQEMEKKIENVFKIKLFALILF
jgi:hypothetical protein